jgi:DNA polymerase
VDQVVLPDINKTLPVLRQQWSQCQNCELGQRRVQVGGQFVFGEGVRGGILFIGEGPGKDEEKEGRPFIGKSGQVLRDVLKRLGLESVSYITNTVCCRSCAQQFSQEGQPITYDDGRPRIVDQAPTALQVQACAARLYEEIYMVDPVLIVTLGGGAAEAMLHRAVTITSECGNPYVVKIPGATHIPQLTEKRQQWLRKVKKQWVMPTAQNYVEYHCILNFHPAYVLRNLKDERKGNPAQRFFETMKLVKRVYNKYLQEVFGQQVAEQQDETVRMEDYG